jgi:hypothetical protein
MDLGLLVLFLLHFLVFLRLAFVHRRVRHARLSLLFAALVTYYALRLFGLGDVGLGSVSVGLMLRLFAYALAAWSVIDMLVRFRSENGE